jgi:SAM-dependent methyltransferase
LDVGGGRGIASYALARDGFSVTTIEPDPSALVGAEAIRSLAAETGLAIEVVEESSERLPFEDNRFNVVFARAVLHHTKSLTAACSEFHRVLKPGGILLAIREHVLSQKADLPAFLEAHPLHHLYGGENAYLLDEYMGAIEQAGFTDLRAIPYWHSAVNFAPYTLRSLQRELVSRIGLGLPGIGGFAARLVGLPAVWWGLQRVLTRLDQRPGRSYSFVASRGAA